MSKITELANSLVISAAGHTDSVDVGENRFLAVSITVLHLSGAASSTAQLETAMDPVNGPYFPIGSLATLNATGDTLLTTTDTALEAVRLKYSAPGSGKALTISAKLLAKK